MTPAFFFSVCLSMTAVCLRAAVIRNITDESLGASAIIEKVNANSTKVLVHGDIVPTATRNAVPCTATGCKWPKTGPYVYVPVSIGTEYSSQERDVIINALVTFHASTCVRFVWRTSHRDFLHFFSGQGCYSYLGRQNGGQLVSLQRNGCLFQSTVQHEVLHALGFHHEQVRSDRDQHVRILTENIITGQEQNFAKVQTNNLGTPYDFNSVMHYGRFDFSKNGQPTIVARSNPNLNFGNAFRMSPNDIARVNRLYGC